MCVIECACVCGVSTGGDEGEEIGMRERGNTMSLLARSRRHGGDTSLTNALKLILIRTHLNETVVGS